jgi:hypothetical protein
MMRQNGILGDQVEPDMQRQMLSDGVRPGDCPVYS